MITLVQSVTRGSLQDAPAEHPVPTGLTDISGSCSITGAVPSTTVTKKLSETELPEPSVAVAVTVVAPIGKIWPWGKSVVTPGNEQLFASSANGAGHETLRSQVSESALVVMLFGTEMKNGGSGSRIVTRKLNSLTFPTSSVAV